MKPSTFKRSLNDFYYTLLFFDLDYHHSRAIKMLQSAHSLHHLTQKQYSITSPRMQNNLIKGKLLYHFFGDVRIPPSLFQIQQIAKEEDVHIFLFLFELLGRKNWSSLFDCTFLKQSQSVQNLKLLVPLRDQLPELSWKELICMNISSYLGLNQRQISEVDEKYQLYFQYLEFIVTPTKFYKHREIITKLHKFSE